MCLKLSIQKSQIHTCKDTAIVSMKCMIEQFTAKIIVNRCLICIIWVVFIGWPVWFIKGERLLVVWVARLAEYGLVAVHTHQARCAAREFWRFLSCQDWFTLRSYTKKAVPLELRGLQRTTTLMFPPPLIAFWPIKTSAWSPSLSTRVPRWVVCCFEKNRKFERKVFGSRHQTCRVAWKKGHFRAFPSCVSNGCLDWVGFAAQPTVKLPRRMQFRVVAPG